MFSLRKRRVIDLRFPEEACVLHFHTAVVEDVRDEVETGDFLVHQCRRGLEGLCDALANLVRGICVFNAKDHRVTDFLAFGHQVAN